MRPIRWGDVRAFFAPGLHAGLVRCRVRGHAWEPVSMPRGVTPMYTCSRCHEPGWLLPCP